MKRKFLKPVLPLGAVLLAVAGAFAAGGNKTAVPPQTGWINLPGQPCHQSVQCRTETGSICTLNYNGQDYQAFGKDPQTMECNVRLYRVN